MEEITISKEAYLKLLEDSNFLYCLNIYGVDNWEGYSLASEMFNDEFSDED